MRFRARRSTRLRCDLINMLPRPRPVDDSREIVAIDVPADHHTTRRFEHDEFIRSDASLEALAALPPQPNTTTMTAGNSSPLSDGASAVVLASERRAAELGISPQARIVASASVAVDPTIMG